jgi:thioredoxin 1
MAQDKEGIVAVITDGNFKDIVEKNSVVVVDCYADWCGPCKIISPLIDQLALEYKSKIKFGKLNVDDNMDTAQSFDVRSIPTLLFFRGGKLVDRMIGVMPKSEIEKRLYNCIK